MSSKLARTIARKKPPKVRRASHGQWVKPAEAVYELVTENEWNVSDATREVVATKFGLTEEDGLAFHKAFNGVRAAYYVQKSRHDDGFDI